MLRIIRALLLYTQVVYSLGWPILLETKRVIHKLLILSRLVVQSWPSAHEIPDHSWLFWYALSILIVGNGVVLIIVLGRPFFISWDIPRVSSALPSSSFWLRCSTGASTIPWSTISIVLWRPHLNLIIFIGSNNYQIILPFCQRVSSLPI